jgi:hypothetical protein
MLFNTTKKNKKGFGLLEMVISISVFIIFVVGIYSGIQFVFKIVYQSRLRILETAILNERVEVIRNMPFENIGIVNGNPAGSLTRTVTTTRNNIEFTLTHTIRNIDDPFDGTIGGIPNDTSPADYKLIDVEIICHSCNQHVPVSVTSFVAPKYLEGDPTHGALFIEVFDASPNPVVGATVHIVASSTDPQIDLIDTTDNNGMLRLVDLAPGIQAYSITVQKDGYTSDQTMAPTVQVENPTKLPASVLAQDVTSISFSIDQASSMTISSQNSDCQTVGNVDAHIIGTKLIGTEPDVFVTDLDFTIDGSGSYSFSQMLWDVYGLWTTNYDLLGSIPALPINILPGVDQPITLIVGANTAHSLIVNVVDSVTGLPVSQASVQITGQSYDNTKNTGVGTIRQTDWSGGDGQALLEDNTRYWQDDGGLTLNDPEGDITLKELGGLYVANGELESSTVDLNVSANFVNIVWEPIAQPQESGENAIQFQLATSNTSTPDTWEYLGPDGTANTYYNENNIAIHQIHNEQQFLRYKTFLHTDTATTTPTLSDVSFTYTTSCTPPGQSYFGSLVNQEYTVEVSRDNYQTTNEVMTVDGDMILSVSLEAE